MSSNLTVYQQMYSIAKFWPQGVILNFLDAQQTNESLILSNLSLTQIYAHDSNEEEFRVQLFLLVHDNLSQKSFEKEYII